MATETFGKVWTKKDAWRSVLLFFTQAIVFIVLAAVLLLADELPTLGETLKTQGGNYLYTICCLLLLFVISYLYFLCEEREILEKTKNILLVFTILDVYLVLSCLIGYKLSIYARPVALVALLVYTLMGRRTAIFMNILCALLIFAIDMFAVPEISAKECYSSLIISFSAGMVAIFLAGKAKTRFKVVGVGLTIVVPIAFVIIILEVAGLVQGVTENPTDPSTWQSIFMEVGFGFFGGIMSTVIYIAILPVFESVFNCLTAFRLRELTSSDAKILKKLKEEAPGTYNHSMMVAQLAEASAAAIGENVDYARAAALYHDVGKLHYPEHFTENQGEYNLHDELTPELSADIIRSHAKDGYTLIRTHHLPLFLADVALEHHGTMPIRYFYAKALKMTDGELNIEDFSYMGPKPQSKLSAIIMIADASEAAVRATNARTPEETERAIRAVIEERMDLEQFAECDVTMADLTKIRLALVNTLTGVYHHRIQYPNIKYRRTEKGTKGESE